MNSTAITPLLIKTIDEHFSKLQHEKVKPWIFLNTGKPLVIERCRNLGKISYSGVTFSGSPREVFWNGFIEPCLEDAALASIKEICGTLIVDKNDSELILNETEAIIKNWVRQIYLEMSEIDQRLRGNGYPNSVGRVDCSDKISSMHKKVEEYVTAHKHLLKPKPKNKTKSLNFWFTVIVGIFTIIGVLYAIFFDNKKPSAEVKQNNPTDSPVITTGNDSSVNITYNKQAPPEKGMLQSQQALVSPVGTQLNFGFVSNDAVGVTSMKQEGKKTLIEIEPISIENNNTWLLDALTIKNGINDAKVWKEKWISNQYDHMKTISSDFASRNMSGGGGFINTLIKSVNSFTEDGELYITELTRKIEQIMVKHGKAFSSTTETSDFHKDYLKIIGEMRQAIKQMQEIPMTKCIQTTDEKRCAEIVRPEKFKKFEPELLQ